MIKVKINTTTSSTTITVLSMPLPNYIKIISVEFGDERLDIIGADVGRGIHITGDNAQDEVGLAACIDERAAGLYGRRGVEDKGET